MASTNDKLCFGDRNSQQFRLQIETKNYLPPKQQSNCLVLYGIPEGKATAQSVHGVLSLANLRKTDYFILHRVGKAKADGSYRPLKVGLAAGVRMPLLKDLAVKIQSRPHLSSVIVSKYETKAAQYAAFLAREERRRQERSETESRSSNSSSPVDICCPHELQRKIEHAAEQLHLLMGNLKLLQQEYETLLPNYPSITYHPTIIDNLADFYSIVSADNRSF